ncbi:MAG: hypothetical protein GY791_18175 [Alphaproteobacteria bacterium]|nr:hypothetical protein [Alphaproteobacteria bacterium]
MRVICKLIAWVFLLAALFCLGYEVVAWNETGQYHIAVLGQIIFDYAPSFLPNLQAGVQRYLHPAIWEPGIQTVLLWPGWAVFGVPGIVLLLLCRRRRKRVHRK